ncbi:MAG TPA: hypothetical protein VGM06_10505 [Polyangiaceae bacterium]
MTVPVKEMLALSVDDGLLEELRAYGRPRGLTAHDVARIALRLGMEALRKPRQADLPGVRR